MVIEEKDLAGLGGWECLKKAKIYVAAGSVLKSSESHLNDDYGSTLFTGHVLEGRKEYICGLKFRTFQDVDNLCRCKRAIKEGRICEHSIAVVLHSIRLRDNSHANKLQVSYDEEDGNALHGESLMPVIHSELHEIGKIESCLILFESSDGDQSLTGQQALALKGVLGNVELSSDLKIRCSKVQLGKIIQLLMGRRVGFKSNDLEKTRYVVVSETKVRLPLTLKETRDEFPTVELSRLAMDQHYFITFKSQLWVLNAQLNVLMPTANADVSETVRDSLSDLLGDPNQESSVLVSKDWLRCNSSEINKLFHMECSDDLIKSIRLLPAKPKLKIRVEGSLKNIEVRAEFLYQKDDIVNGSLEEAHLQSLGGQGAKNFTSVMGAVQSNSTKINTYKWAISGENNVFAFYAGELDQVIRVGEVEVILGDRFYTVTKEIEKVRPRVKVREVGDNFFDFELEFIGTRGTKISENEIRLLLSQGKSSLEGANGALMALNAGDVNELFTSFEVSSMDQSVDQGTVKRRVKSAETFYVEELLHDLADFEYDAAWQDINTYKFGFSAELREYQKRGVAWMNRRLSRGCGVILADEMGLGKTIQTLALICSAEWLKGPTLIICPTSLIDNWRREIEKFTNNCKILILHGQDRVSKLQLITSSDLIITSYATVVKDRHLYKEIHFPLIVADESSYLKNPDTKIFSALSELNAHGKIALSGTPLENKLLDLWSVMELVNPSYLGDRKNFASLYSADISESDRLILKRRVSPFVLRRTKKKVLDELPAKTEKIVHCALTSTQIVAYEGILRTGKEQLLKFHSKENEKASRMEILSLLLRLRQICCDSNLIQSKCEESANVSSGKIEPMMKILRSSISSGGKVLVFSQFVRMLKIIESTLNENGINYYFLDGSTPREKRDEQVQAFQNDKNGASVFLISLKAGGYGLNLTAADTVIHFDPWWNPSVENQATDRAHRMGQTKSVNAYKLIAAGTVEEKILKLQDHKKGLIDVAINDAEPMMNGLTDDDIKTILS